MKKLDRRRLLKASAAGLALRTVPLRATSRDEILDLADRLAETSRERVFDLVAPLVQKGLRWQDLLAAVFFAGCRHIRPRPVGFKLHAVLVVESFFQLGEAGSEEEAMLGAFWNLDDFKNSQQRDVDEGDWTLSPAPQVRFPSKEAAARELARALEAGEEERADRAVVGAAALLSHDELFDFLWPHALRDFHNLGHKPIHAAHVEAVLRRTGVERGRPALRALVHGLLDGDSVALDEHARTLALTDQLRTDWMQGKRDAEQSLALAFRLCEAEAGEARQQVLEAVNAGLHPETVWDGLRLAATDQFARGPSLLPVHPTTVTCALHAIQLRARDETTRRAALLQAAAWLPLFREWFLARGQFLRKDAGLDALLEQREGEPVSVEALFRHPSRRAALACLSEPGAFEPYSARLRAQLLRGAREHHEIKYAAALFEGARFADPRWRPTLFAAALDYLPSAATSTTTVHRRAREILAG